jgi:hypothetical protein
MGQRRNIKRKTTEEYIEETTRNISEDRAVASKLLFEVIQKLENEGNTLNQRRLGEVAAKYLEVLQRSNEQLVKITTIVKDIEEDEREKEDSLDSEDIFDSIRGDK